ncbi:MAG: transcription termination/antitermination NusG family protein [bacterium]
MYRVKDNPDSRFPAGRSLEDDLGKWMIAHLRSRREKAFALELADKQIGYFLPLFERRVLRCDTGKVRKTINPLFPGYIAFVNDGQEHRIIATSKHVANIIKIPNQPDFVKELIQVQRVLDENIELKTHEELYPGTRVRILYGPLSGIEGVVITHDKKSRLVLGVEMFGQSVSMNIDENNLVKIK